MAVDLLLDVAILLSGEGGIVEQHLQPFHCIVVTEFVKCGRFPLFGERDVLEAGRIQDGDLELLRSVGTGSSLQGSVMGGHNSTDVQHTDCEHTYIHTYMDDYTAHGLNSYKPLL